MRPAKRRLKKTIRRKAKGSRVKFVKKKPGPVRCPCGAIISKNGKRPNRPFKNLCTKCVRTRLKEVI